MSWLRLPMELKLSILRRLLACPSPIDHSAHIDILVCGELETLISTNNTELVRLALQAYYKFNTFIIKSETSYRGFSETKIFRPREKHALQMQHFIDETAPTSPSAGVDLRMDSGYASRTDDGVDAGSTAPDVTDLARALEKAVEEEDPAAKKAARTIKLFDLFNSNDIYLRSQRKTPFWTEVPSDKGNVAGKTDPFSLPGEE